MTVVSVNVEAQIATIEINNPPVNVLSEAVVEGLLEAVQLVEERADVKVVILTGAGNKAFMAGGDIKSFPQWIGKGEALAEEKALWLQKPLDAVAALPHPTICVINGVAFGGGCELALSCDFRIAEQHSQIGLPEISLGLLPGAGGTQRLPRLIGLSKAKELIFSGEALTAEEAQGLGLVDQVAPSNEGMNYAKKLAEKFLPYSTEALMYAKKAIDEGMQHGLADGLKIEAKYFGKVFQTENVQEGVQAFIEKRPAMFK